MPIPVPQRRRLLFTGSREINAIAQALVERSVRLAIKKGWYIIVGDAPEGVDGWVIDTANKLKYANISVYGAYGRMRKKTDYGQNVVTSTDYLGRDVTMAQLCGRCLAFWNGHSGGTIYTFKKAIEHGCVFWKTARALVVDGVTGEVSWLRQMRGR